MQKLTLFQKRSILLFLDSKDKLLTFVYLSKEFHDLIYSGYAWEVLFSNQYDKKWIPQRISLNLLRKFKHFKGVNDIHLNITPALQCMDILHEHLTEFSNFYLHQDVIGNPKFTNKNRDKVLKLVKYPSILKKLRNQPYGISPLHIASHCNYAEELLETINEDERFEECNKYDDKFQSPLHYAVKSSKTQPKTLQALIKNGGDINHFNRYRKTPLNIAAKVITLKKKDLLLTLIENGGMSGESGKGTLVFYMCQHKRQEDIIQFCLDSTPHQMCFDDAQALLTYRILTHKSFESVKQIANRGLIDFHDKPKYTLSYLHNAILHEADNKIIKFLINKVDHFKNFGYLHNERPLHHAVFNNCDLQIIKLLLKKGADINSRNTINKTALDIAMLKDNIKKDEVKFLVENGGNFSQALLFCKNHINQNKYFKKKHKQLVMYLEKELGLSKEQIQGGRKFIDDD